MARPIWSGAISFGLINVPVKLVSAVQRQSVRFHELHDKDKARIRHKRVCSAEDEEVPYENIVKGYELDKDRYVVVEPEELERLDPKRTKTIDIEDFVPLAEIDPVFFDSSYYLVPDGEPAVKPYHLLRRAMEDADRVAIGRVVIRTKEHLAALRAADDVLTVSTMLFADEVVPREALELPESAAQPGERELKMARELVESLSTDFEPERYRDEYRERVIELIECKARGDEVVKGPDAEPATDAPDLMAALEASLAAAREGAGAESGSNGGSKKRRGGSRERAKT